MLGDRDAVERKILSDLSLVQAVQRIRLDDCGRKVERRSLGPMGNAVVFVDGPMTHFYSASATISEGVETALAMRTIGFEANVALSGAGRFRTFQPPWIWSHLTISGERDAGASEKAWRDAGPRWAVEGHDVHVWAPPLAQKDANDILITKAREGRAA